MNLVGIINQLRRERDLIDRAIAALEALRRGQAGGDDDVGTADAEDGSSPERGDRG